MPLRWHYGCANAFLDGAIRVLRSVAPLRECVLQLAAAQGEPAVSSHLSPTFLKACSPTLITRETLALPEFIIGVSFQKEPITNLEYRVGEGLGRLLREIMSRIDDAVFMQPDKHAGVLCLTPAEAASGAPSIVTVGTFPWASAPGGLRTVATQGSHL